MIESSYLTVSGHFSMKCVTAGLYSGAPNKTMLRRRNVGTVTTFSGNICGTTPAEIKVFNAVIAPIESPQYVAFVVMVRKWLRSSGAGYRCLCQSSSSLGMGRLPGSLNNDAEAGPAGAECTEKLGGLATQIKTSACGSRIGPQASANIGAIPGRVEPEPRLAPIRRYIATAKSAVTITPAIKLRNDPFFPSPISASRSAGRSGDGIAGTSCP